MFRLSRRPHTTPPGGDWTEIRRDTSWLDLQGSFIGWDVPKTAEEEGLTAQHYEYRVTAVYGMDGDSTERAFDSDASIQLSDQGFPGCTLTCELVPSVDPDGAFLARAKNAPAWMDISPSEDH